MHLRAQELLWYHQNTSLMAAQALSVSTRDDLIDQVLGDAKRFLADLLNRRSVGKQATCGASTDGLP